MNTMDWTAIIQTLIGAGGVTGLFLITERKTAAALKNMETMYNILKGQYEDLLSRDNEKDKKIDLLYDKIGTLHVEKDAATTKAATSEMKRCDYIFCTKRQPPLADKWRMDLEKGGEDEQQD
jgi:hypothetical protein